MKQCQWFVQLKSSIEISYVAQLFKLVVGFARKPVFNDKEVWSNILSHVPVCYHVNGDVSLRAFHIPTLVDLDLS